MTTDRHSCSNALRIGFAAAFALLASTDAAAHRMDEYLQAARIGIGPDVVDVYLDLTPGVAVAESIVAEIDLDRDGRISSDEEQSYARGVGRELQIELDGHPLGLRLVSSEWPEPSTFLLGEGTLRLHLQASWPVPSGTHALFFRNLHRAIDSVYLANALVPDSPRVRVKEQRRSRDQSELTIDYSLSPTSAAATLSPWVLSLAATALTVFLARRRPAS